MGCARTWRQICDSANGLRHKLRHRLRPQVAPMSCAVDCADGRRRQRAGTSADPAIEKNPSCKRCLGRDVVDLTCPRAPRAVPLALLRLLFSLVLPFFLLSIALCVLSALAAASAARCGFHHLPTLRFHVTQHFHILLAGGCTSIVYVS